MSFLKKFICILLCVSLIFSFAACGKYNDEIIYFGLNSAEIPQNIDPQTAFEDIELMIVRNIFEGLLRKDKDGKIVPAAASSYKKSGNGYIFTLRDDLKWSNKESVTAEDFAFGIERAMQKETNCPFAERFASVDNISAVGNKIKISLKYDDANFLETLTMAAAMPCNKDFFYSTEGKYGQSSDAILCNGSYTVKKWNREEFGMRIYRSLTYNGRFKAANGGVFFSLPAKNKEETQLSRLQKASCDLAFLPSGELNSAKKSGIKITSVQNICWVLTLGNEYDMTVKTALLSAIKPELYENSLPMGYDVAHSLFPNVLSIDDANGIGFTPYDLGFAKATFSATVSQMPDKKFPSPTLYYYEKSEIKQIITSAIGNWQEELSAFVNITPAKFPDELQKQLGDKTLQMAVFPVFVKTGSVNDYLKNFNKSGNPVLAQKEILSDKSVIPFAFENTNIGYLDFLDGVKCDIGNGYFDFSFVYKN